MKNIILAACTLFSGMMAFAINPGEMVLLKQDATSVFHPVLSPDGNTLLFSSQDHTGLNAMNLNDKSVVVIDDAAAAGFCPVFSTDGKTIVYRTADTIDGLTYRDVRSFRLDSDASAKIIRPMSRKDENLNSIAGDTDYAYADYRTIKVCHKGNLVDVSPIADAHSYLWASIPPDGSKQLFPEPFTGVYVCNIDGTDVRRIAPKGDFAAWADNSMITYVDSKDDGYVIVSSQLYAYDLVSGRSLVITPDNVIVGEATAAAGKVVFSTLAGQLYSVTLK